MSDKTWANMYSVRGCFFSTSISLLHWFQLSFLMKIDLLLQPIGCEQRKSRQHYIAQTNEKPFTRLDFRIQRFLGGKKFSLFYVIFWKALKTFVVCCTPRHSSVFNKSSKESSLFVKKNFHCRCHFIFIIKRNHETINLCGMNVCVLCISFTRSGCFQIQAHDSIVRYDSKHDSRHDIYDKRSWLMTQEYEFVTQSRKVTSLFHFVGENGPQAVLLVLAKVSFI